MNTLIVSDDGFDFWPYSYHIKQAIAWFLDDNEIDAVVRDLDSCYQDSRVQVFADASEMIQQFRRKNAILEEALRMAVYQGLNEKHTEQSKKNYLIKAEEKLFPEGDKT